MLSIKINTDFLDLPADVSMEMNRNNPFLSDDIQGEYSLGLSIRYSDKNYNILNYTGNFTKRNQKHFYDAEIWENGAFRYAGKLTVTQHQGNMNNIEDTVWTAMFTIGSATFMQEIQDILLQDVDMGGTRSFKWTGVDIGDSSGGFWQMVHAARTPNAYPYTFYPIYDENWMGIESVTATHFINWLTRLGDNQFFLAPNMTSLCPAIYLSYLLERIFANFGWTISGEILNDPGFKKITIPSFRTIDWWNYHHVTITYPTFPRKTIVFDLADHLAPETTIGSFLVSLKNRMGWYFDFDSNSKTAYLRSYDSLEDGAVKDWTQFVQSIHTAEYSDDDKIYSLVNNIDPNDTYPTIKEIDESNVLRVTTLAGLPTPVEALDQQVAFIGRENKYYICDYDDASFSYKWIFWSDNVGDYTPLGNNDSIESDISTMPSGRYEHTDSGSTIDIPVCDQIGNYPKSGNGDQTWGVRFLFYHGMTHKDSAGNYYPYASEIDDTWSLPYKYEYGTINNGVYDYWWKGWLEMLGIQDLRTMTLALPITELKRFKFSDLIFINNVFFVVQSAKEVLPYTGLIEMKLKRIY